MYGYQRHTNNFTCYKFALNLSQFLFLDRRDGGERQRRKMTAQGEAVSLIVQNLRPGKKERKKQARL
jgi:hypothetical protein